MDISWPSLNQYFADFEKRMNFAERSKSVVMSSEFHLALSIQLQHVTRSISERMADGETSPSLTERVQAWAVECKPTGRPSLGIQQTHGHRQVMFW